MRLLFVLISEYPPQTAEHQITDTFTELLEEQIRKKPEYYLLDA